MFFDFSEFFVTADSAAAKKASELFIDEIKLRNGGKIPDGKKNEICFRTLSGDETSEDFSVEIKDSSAVFSAHRLRGFVYAYGLFLRKSEFKNGKITLTENISGNYSPDKKVRGHQIGYRDLNNTYDAWSVDTFRRYLLDLMLFGVNTYEGIPGGDDEKNSFMEMNGNQMLCRVSEICCEIDLDFSVWHPTGSQYTDEQTREQIKEYYTPVKKLDCLFIPGGDPGDLKADDLFKRIKIMKEALADIHPNAKIWVSAQAPHQYADWGDRFIDEMEKLPDYIDGIIYGPNHAMPLDELRRRTPERYPIRFYPDITHSVRCEYPVHFDKDDWHYTFASALGRESVDPRPTEYRKIHALTRSFVCGSVSYSDGINDDVNKTVWSALDFDPNTDIGEILRDYARAFLPETDAAKFADSIFMLEKNWDTSPMENPFIETTLDTLKSLLNAAPSLKGNYRFMMCYFRAVCDSLVQRRMIFEENLIKEAVQEIEFGSIKKFREILETPFDGSYTALREEADSAAKILNETIGMQLDVATYGGKYWERGCTLDTLDRPLTDRAYLLQKLALAEKTPDPADFMKKIISRNKTGKGEIYLSFALHGFDFIGRQSGDFYMDFQGDTPKNDGSLPMCMIKVYDHFNFNFSFCSPWQNGCRLRITYKDRGYPECANEFKITVNGKTLYCGEPYGGVKDDEYDALYLADGYTARAYEIPQSYFVNGAADIEITEPLKGFMINEFRIEEL